MKDPHPPPFENVFLSQILMFKSPNKLLKIFNINNI